MDYFKHPNALCESRNIGKGTRLWAFSHILPNAVVGQNCNICDGVFIENDVQIGDSVTIKCGVQLWDGTVIENDVFIGPNATFTNDPFPRSQKHLSSYPKTIVKQGASIGANATILPGITIGAGAMIGAGSVVTKDVPEFAIVVGNPARISGYVNTEMAHSETIRPESLGLSGGPIVPGVKLLKLKSAFDLRGSLVAAEVGSDIPFIPKRFFSIYDVPSKEARGSHAHKTCHQFLICVSGSVAAIVDNGVKRQEILLDSPDVGLYMPPGIWGTQYKYSENAVLVVLASHSYDSSDYIRDYKEFTDFIKSNGPAK